MKHGGIISLLTLLSFASLPAMAWGQKFDDYFCDTTLRLDYVFAGNKNVQHIAVDEYCKSVHWYGKRHNLACTPIEGNGQITVKDHKSGIVIYKNSFSTLFQEWLSYPEAEQLSRAFQNVFLIPMPKDTVDITIDLRNNRHEIASTLTHQVVPHDILIKEIGKRDRTAFSTVQEAKNSAKRINVAFVAEGYAQHEMDVFRADVHTAVEALFAHEPFKGMRDVFNMIAVEAPSAESGTSEPGKGVWKNTALHSHFNTFYSDRYLTTLNLKDLHDILAGLPYEHIIVLVNSDKYGGGGILNSYNLSATHFNTYEKVIVHEFGHSFAGLADEYAYENEQIPSYPHDIEPWERNITTLTNFESKWKSLIDRGTAVPTPLNKDMPNRAGVYEGAGYSLSGVYRAFQDCRMRSNNTPEFCPVCQKAIQEVIDFYTK